jgi:hypothetical protein
MKAEMKPEYVPLLLGFATFLGTLAVVVIGFLYSNSRISDLRAHVDTRIGDLRQHFDDRLERLEEVFDARLTRIEEHLSLR